MKKQLLLLFTFFIFSFSYSFSQDTIRTKNDTLIGKVLEIGIDVIRYNDISNINGPVISILKSDVVEIRYENGSKFLIKPDPYEVNKAVEVRKKSHAIKFEFLSPVTNDIAFGYESMIKVGKNLEIKLGVIGPGTQPNEEKASGMFFKGGIKFLTSPTYYIQGIKYAHSLHGTYIKPEIIVNSYTKSKSINNPIYNGNYYVSNVTSEKIRYTNLCFNIVFGKQFLLGNILTFDYYFGIGYGFRDSNFNSDNLIEYYDNENYSYSHSYIGDDSPLIVTGGLTLGVLF